MGPRWSLINCRTKQVVTTDLQLAASWFRRLVGLQFRRRLPRGGGLLLAPCNSVHTCFLFFSLDVAILDIDGRVIDVRRNLRPWRAILPIRAAHAVLEMNADELSVEIGDVVAIESHDAETDLPKPLRSFARSEVEP